MRLTRRLRATLLVATVLSIVAITTAAGPASAAVTAASAARAGTPVTPAGQVTPNASDNLYFCDYDIAFDNIAAWEWPGGAGRSGNHAFMRALAGMAFNAIPWISSGTINGMRWIYGAVLVPDSNGNLHPTYGWVGRNYVTTPRCDTAGFQTSNLQLAGSHQGDDFVSQPNMVSASFRGQTWVWGVDPFSTSRAGWVGRTWLTLNSCNASACFYTINAANTHEWILPGGAPGP